jgi:hypothetical protein
MFGSIFCNVENFFFISLAIIFILVLLLVYLFKQRISTVEKTGNTMFDMVRRLTDEVKWLKGFSKEEEKCVIGSPDTTIPISKSIPEKHVDMSAPKKPVEPARDVVRDTIHFEIVEPVPGFGPDSKRIVVEDLGDSDSDDEESDDSDESDVESDEESDVDDVSIGGMEIELDVENLDSDQPVQLVNIESDDVGEEVEITVDDIHELETEVEGKAEIEIKAVDEPIVHTVDDLKKMDVRQLRQLAFQKTGQDVSKTKKNELVRMLTVSVSIE